MGIFAYPRRKVNSDRTAKAALVLVRISANFLKDCVHLRGLWLKRQRLTTGDVHPNCRSLKERSLAANLRQELGHWEGALAVGKQNKATFVASVDRKSVSFLSRTPAMSRPPFGVTPGEGRKFSPARDRHRDGAHSSRWRQVVR